MNTLAETVISPCIKQCSLDSQDICLGCFRSMAEIIDWPQANGQRRSDILDNAKMRRLHRLIDENSGAITREAMETSLSPGKN